MKFELKIEYLMFWIVLILLVIFLIWRTFGSSPTIEAVSFLLTAAGVGVGWIGLKASFRADAVHEEQTKILTKVQETLEEISKKL